MIILGLSLNGEAFLNMKLEDEIKQRDFKTPQQKLAINLLYTVNWLNSKYADNFKSTDITPQQFNVLRILRGQYPKPCNLKLIKERMLDKMSDASRITDKLLNKGLIERQVCPDDRRAVNILISKKGLDTLKSLDFIDEESAKYFEKLNAKEVSQLNELLDKLRDSSK